VRSRRVTKRRPTRPYPSPPGRDLAGVGDEGAVPGHLAGDLDRDETAALLDRWCARAQRSRLAPFVKVARTMRERCELLLNAVEHGISNGRVEGLNTKVRLLIRRAYGFHSADAALALVMLAAGPTSSSGEPEKGRGPPPINRTVSTLRLVGDDESLELSAEPQFAIDQESMFRDNATSRHPPSYCCSAPTREPSPTLYSST